MHVNRCHWQPVALALFREDEFIIINNIVDETPMELHRLKDSIKYPTRQISAYISGASPGHKRDDADLGTE